jgi:hypothetical protein
MVSSLGGRSNLLHSLLEDNLAGAWALFAKQMVPVMGMGIKTSFFRGFLII